MFVTVQINLPLEDNFHSSQKLVCNVMLFNSKNFTAAKIIITLLYATFATGCLQK